MASAVVVYESVFGDAEAIARAIADGLSEHLDVEVITARDAPLELGAGLRLLVVGGPNHALGMPRPATRDNAVANHGAEIADTTSGLREWLDRTTLTGVIHAAAFDTRMEHPRLLTTFDHASRTEEKLLRARGATLAAPSEHFHVVDVTGPLAAGEQDRAREWGRSLAAIVRAEVLR